MALTDLPTELIDHIFSYLDWDPTQSLYPTRDDVLNGSLTCRTLRKALEPAIFKHITLRLCWSQGQLLEPRWYCLRRMRPELSRHVRTVYIHTGNESEQCLHCINKTTKTFVVPETINDWLKMSYENEKEQHATTILRARVNEYAKNHYENENATGLEGISDQAEHLVRLAKSQPRFVTALDALSVFMLCIPASTTSIVFKASLEGLHYMDKNRFSYRVLSVALELLHDRIKDLTVISNQSVSRPNRRSRMLAGAAAAPPAGPVIYDQDWIPNEIISKQSITRLTLGIDDEHQFGRNTRPFAYEGWEKWHQFSHTLRELNIRYTMGESTNFLKFIKGFPDLAILRIRNCALCMAHIFPRSYESDAWVWLSLAIEMRKALPLATIELDNLWLQSTNLNLLESAVRWIVSQAIPKGALIDVEREDRLVEDFVSFLPLWAAEDGGSGSEAMAAWGTQRAQLGDQAMSRRWR